MADGVKKINEWIMKEGRVIGITKDISASKFEGGTFFVHPNQGTLKYNNVDNAGNKSWKKFVPVTIFDEKTIVRSLLDDKVINESKLEDFCVTTNKIADDSIVSKKLKNSCIITEKIADLNVTTEKLADYVVTEYKIRDYSVSTNKIKNLAVTTDKIALKNVINNHIADDTIKNEKLFSKTIDNTKIKDLTVIESLLGPDSVTSTKIKELAIKSSHIDINQVKTTHVLDRNITGPKVATNCLKDEHMMDNSINANKLMDGSLKTDKIADLNVTNSKIAKNAVDMDKLESNLQGLIKDAIRVEGANNTATVKGNLKVNGNIDATGNITGVKVYNPVFADVAEAYFPTMKVEPGDAVCLLPCGSLLVEPLSATNAHLFLGFVSDQYAACYGAVEEELKSGVKTAVALTGRIPVKMDTTHEDARVGSYIGISNGKIVAYKQAINYFYKPQTAIGRIIDVIDDKTALVQI